MSEVLFKGNVQDLSEKNIEELLGNMAIELKDENINIVDLLLQLKIASSKREAREFLSNSSISLNGNKINDENIKINKSKALFNRYIVIRRGTKKYSVGEYK